MELENIVMTLIVMRQQRANSYSWNHPCFNKTSKTKLENDSLAEICFSTHFLLFILVFLFLWKRPSLSHQLLFEGGCVLFTFRCNTNFLFTNSLHNTIYIGYYKCQSVRFVFSLCSLQHKTNRKQHKNEKDKKKTIVDPQLTISFIEALSIYNNYLYWTFLSIFYDHFPVW